MGKVDNRHRVTLSFVDTYSTNIASAIKEQRRAPRTIKVAAWRTPETVVVLAAARKLLGFAPETRDIQIWKSILTKYKKL